MKAESTFRKYFCNTLQIYIKKFNGRKINVWSANKHPNKLHTAVSVAFSVPSSVQSKNWWKTALIYSFIADPTERGGAKG